MRPDDAGSRARLRAATRLRLPEGCVPGAAVQVGGSIAAFDEALAAAGRRRGLPVLG